MPGRECVHCKHWVEQGDTHDCWTTTETALTGDLSEDLRDAWDRLRETAAAFGEQRIHASHRLDHVLAEGVLRRGVRGLGQPVGEGPRREETGENTEEETTSSRLNPPVPEYVTTSEERSWA